jgi:NAD(P)-dependent dehydrogenase (short-subunit alcohol dehydrogenase family)
LPADVTLNIAALQQFASERKLPLEAIELDVCDDASVERCIAQIERTAGPVEVLVNNAGIAIAAAMEEITLAVWSFIPSEYTLHLLSRDTFPQT